MANNPTISQIRVPNGTGATDYDIADLEARSGLATVSGNVNTLTTQVIPEIAGRVTGVEVAISGTGGTGGIYAELDAINKALVAGIRIIGATSTELHEGDTTDKLDPVTTGSLSKLEGFEKGDVVFYTKVSGGKSVIQEFVKTDRTYPLEPEKSGVWVLFGDSSILENSLGNFAYTGSVSYTPRGIINDTEVAVTGTATASGVAKNYKTVPLYNDSSVVNVVSSENTGTQMHEVGIVNSFTQGQMPAFSVVAGPSSTNILQLTSGTLPDLQYENVTFQYGNRLAPSSTYTGGAGAFAEVVTSGIASGQSDKHITVIESLSTVTVSGTGAVTGLTFSGTPAIITAPIPGA